LARPNWEYIRIDVLLPGHPKLAALGRSARWTLVELWCHCGQYHTDGWVREAVWKTIGSPADRKAIVAEGLAEPAPAGGFIMHDYTEHNRSKQEIDELSARRAEAGRKGGSSRAKPQASALASACLLLTSC
jgi:sugar (pentulose or hexulose) kinase